MGHPYSLKGLVMCILCQNVLLDGVAVRPGDVDDKITIKDAMGLKRVYEKIESLKEQYPGIYSAMRLVAEKGPGDVKKAGPCPNCGEVMEGVMSNNNKTRKGALTVCSKCASILRFADEETLVEATPEEFLDLPANERTVLQQFQEAVHKLRAHKHAVH
jgi:hypothetical protein